MNESASSATNQSDPNDKTKLIEVNTTQFRDVLKFKHVFWILSISCVVVYG